MQRYAQCSAHIARVPPVLRLGALGLAHLVAGIPIRHVHAHHVMPLRMIAAIVRIWANWRMDPANKARGRPGKAEQRGASARTCLCSRSAATEESTPPDTPTATRSHRRRPFAAHASLLTPRASIRSTH